MKLLAIVAMLAAGLIIEARADDRCTWVAVTVASKHLSESKSGKNYEEFNTGLGIENCLGDVWGFPIRGTAGFFRNSNRIDSLYMGGSAEFARFGHVAFGLAALLVSGYEVEPIKALFPVMSIEGQKFGGNVSYFPKSRDTGAALGFQVKFRWR
jgi:hypothetical protein